MRTHFDCIPCFTRQIKEVLRLALGKQAEETNPHAEKAFRAALSLLSSLDWQSASPPVVASLVHRRLREFTHVADPYAQVKRTFNSFALGILPDIQRIVESQRDPFEASLRVSIAANVIDLGVTPHLQPDAVKAHLAKSTAAPLHCVRTSVEDLRRSMISARRLLLLGDNSGEIVFDKLLLQQIVKLRRSAKGITYAVRGLPVLNDALLEDANEVGISRCVRTISNGSSVPGTHLPLCSPHFRREFALADVVVAKGQGNFESLHGLPERVRPPRMFSLLMVKCPVVAKILSIPIGTMTLAKH